MRQVSQHDMMEMQITFVNLEHKLAFRRRRHYLYKTLKQPIAYMTTPENKTLFLGDLSRFCTEIELEELFSQHGHVLETKISRTSTGISLGYGFICMAERGQAEEAMKNLVGVVLSGRPLRIDWAARNVRDNNSYASNNNMINSIHVRYHTLQRMDGLFTEETLKRFFEAYGKVVDVSIKNSSMDQVNGIQRGYGFVHFEKTVEGTEAAVFAVNNEVGDSTVSLECEVSKNLLKHNPNLWVPSNNDKDGNAASSSNYPQAKAGWTEPAQGNYHQASSQVPMHQNEQIHEPSQEYYEQCQRVYYRSPSVSGDSTPKMCYPPMLHPIHMAPCMTTVHPMQLQNMKSYDMSSNSQESYQQAGTGQGKWLYVYSAENEKRVQYMTPMATHQQMCYACPEDQYAWATNTSGSTSMTDGEGSDCSTPHSVPEYLHSSHDLVPEANSPDGHDLVKCDSYDQVMMQQPEFTTYMTSGHMSQQDDLHLSRSYPTPYVTYVQPMPQNSHYIFQATHPDGSPLVTNRAYYSPSIASPTHLSSPQINAQYSPIMTQSTHSPLGTYQTTIHALHTPNLFQGNRTFPCRSDRSGCMSYSSAVDLPVNMIKNQRQPFITKASVTLQKFKSLH